MKRLMTFLVTALLASQIWAAYTTYVTAYPAGGGKVSLASGSGYTLNIEATGSYSSSTVSVYAQAATGYKFLGWATSKNFSAYIATTSPYSLKPSSYSNQTVYAIFAPSTDQTATVTQNGSGGTTNWAGTVPSGYKDMGLPSGVLWSTSDLSGFYKWNTDASTNSYGSTNYNVSTKVWSATPTALASEERLPTADEFSELINLSYSTASVSSGKLTVTSKSNSNKIEFAKSGNYASNSIDNNNTYFWTTTWVESTGSNLKAKALQVTSSSKSVTSGGIKGYTACKIRPVRDPVCKTLTIIAGSATYNYKCKPNQKVTVTPSPASSAYKFSSWSKTSGTTLPIDDNTFTVSGDATYTAIFADAGYTVTVDDDGHGTATATNGTSTATSTGFTKSITATSVNLSVSNPATGYEFWKWQKDGVDQAWSATQNSVSVTAATTFKAWFKLKTYSSVSFESNDDDMGSVSASPSKSSYTHGDEVILTASAETGYTIQKWQKNGSDIEGSEGQTEIEVTITAADTYTAVFQVASSSWTITATAGSNGSVSPSGAQEYDNGDPVEITATPNAGYRFLKWVDESSNEVTDNPLGFLASTDKTFTAHFVALAEQTDVIYQDIAKNGRNYDYSFDESEYFTLTVIGNGKNTYKCLNGQQVTISVAHEAGWDFSKWSDDNTSNPRTFTVSANTTCRAIFVKSPGTAATATSTPSIPAHDGTISQNNTNNGTYTLLAAVAPYSSDYVDLGLSVLWGTSNITNNGGFFAWGETNGSKDSYSSSTYSNGTEDIAYYFKQSPWRMPTSAEFEELVGGCDWAKEGATAVGTAKARSASITLQANGYKSFTSTMSANAACYYWAGNLKTESSAYCLKIFLSDMSIYPTSNDSRYVGMNVRAVYPAPSPRFTLTVGTNIGAAVNKYIMDAAHNTITIYAQPLNDGSRFVQWNDGNTDNPRTFTISENTSVTAQFTAYAGTTAAAGNWETAATWNNSIRPSATANATVNHAVTIGDGVDNVEVFQSFAKANTLTASAALTVKSGAYLTATNMVVNNTVTLESGSNTTLSGLTINAGGNLVIEDGANVTLPATVTNKGTLTTAKNLSITTLQQEGGSYAGAGTITVGTLNNTAAWNITSLGNLSVGTLVNTSTLTIGADAVITLGTLTTTSGTTTLAPTAALKLTSGVNAAAANLVLQSSAAGNAQLILPNSGTIQPYATVQLYTGAKREGSVYTWQHFGVPTTGTGAAWTRSQAVDTWVYNWDPQDQWANAEYASASELFATPFQGHNLTNVSDGGVVYTFTGQTVGNIASAFDFVKKGWNHLANSYTATVSLEDILNAMPSDVEASVYTYDGGTMHQATLGEIQGGEATVTNLKPMQAFFLHATAEGVGQQDLSYGTIVVDPTVANAPRRMVAPDYTGRVFITATSNSGVADQVKLREAAEWSSSVWNNMDGSKLIANGHGIYAINNGRLAAFATDNLVGTTLGFTAGTDSEYTLTFSNILGEAYTLLDNQTGARVEMKAGESYTFNAEPKSVNEARFIIVERRNTPTALDEVETLQGVQKFVENGNVIILKDGVRYNVLGTQMQ